MKLHNKATSDATAPMFLRTLQALLNFKGILNAADGIIISRGNLGLDCLPEKMALIQKTLIQVREESCL